MKNDWSCDKIDWPKISSVVIQIVRMMLLGDMAFFILVR